MDEQEWMGRVAYNAYCYAFNYKVEGEPAKLWDDLEQETKERWVRVSQFTIEEYKRECNRKGLN